MASIPRNNPPANRKPQNIDQANASLTIRATCRHSAAYPSDCRNCIARSDGRAHDLGVIRWWIETAALSIEGLAVAIIVIATAHGTVTFLVQFRAHATDAYERFKVQLGKSLLLGLEMLVAADVIRTVTLEPTMQNVLMLAVLVIVRTFLSWSLVVEIEGHWPWKR
jgi:uncharacterized membrane protein